MFSSRWVDLHVHILPGFDDGASNMEVAMEMARIALADGIKEIVATPHVESAFEAMDYAHIHESVRELNNSFQTAGLAVTIWPGSELPIDIDLPDRLEGSRGFTLAGSRYLLLELPMGNFPLFTDELVFRLQLAGYGIVLAHPERNGRVIENPDLLVPLVERGVLIQLTAASIVGEFGKEVRSTCEYLLRRNLAHIIASDAHDDSRRRPQLSPAVQLAAEIVGADTAESMVCQIPRAILADERVDPGWPMRPARSSISRRQWLRSRGEWAN